MTWPARLLIFLFVLTTSGVLPAFAWARAVDPCLEEAAEHVDDCRSACQCPCCPLRVSFDKLAGPRLETPIESPPLVPPASPLLAGVEREIFHPPNC
jgi:hypothetical protein